MLYTQVHCINIAMLVNIMKLVHMYYLHVIRFTVYNVLCIINFYRLQGHPYDCFPQGLMYNYIISKQKGVKMFYSRIPQNSQKPSSF